MSNDAPVCDYSLCLCLAAAWLLAVNADDSWRQIQTEARGQTVWFNAWGGDPAVNRYLAWVSEEVKRYYAINVLCLSPTPPTQ